MRILLKDQSTAAQRRVRFELLEEVDDYTPMTGEAGSFVAADIQVSKNGATAANSAGTVTEISQGNYYYEATAGEVDTEGFVLFTIVYSGARRKTIEAHVSSLEDYATALLDMTDGVETGRTLRQTQRLKLSVLCGKLDGAGTAEERFRDTNDTKNRVTSAVESTGNRTAVTLDDT